MRRTGRLVVVALATSFAVLDVAEIAARVAPSPAEPFKLPTPKVSEIPTYLPWIKTCWQQENEKVCATRSDGWLRNGETAVSVMLFEQEGRSDKFLRVKLASMSRSGRVRE